MPENELKPVDMHEAFKRDPESLGSEKLTYANLSGSGQEALTREPALFRGFLRSEENSLEEDASARDAAVNNLVITGAQLQRAHPSEKPRLSEWFTQSSIELYGRPNTAAVEQLAAKELREFESLIGNPAVDQSRLAAVIGVLRPQLMGAEIMETESDDYGPELKLVREVIEQRYGEIIGNLQKEGETKTTKIPAAEVAVRFQEALDQLALKDPAWEGWRAEVTMDAAMETFARKRLVGVGKNEREVGNLAVSFAHEVLGHALRSVNGSKTHDPRLTYGMPDSHIAEEGVAVFEGSSFRGGVSAASKDFYTEISFALGQHGQPPMTRRNMFDFHLNKLVIRQQAKGKDANPDSLEGKAWRHVDRIYRGSLGDEHVAVNTLDGVYYDGFNLIGGWIRQSLGQGWTIEKIFDFMTAAKIDPTNPEHVDYPPFKDFQATSASSIN